MEKGSESAARKSREEWVDLMAEYEAILGCQSREEREYEVSTGIDRAQRIIPHIINFVIVPKFLNYFTNNSLSCNRQMR